MVAPTFTTSSAIKSVGAGISHNKRLYDIMKEKDAKAP